MSDDQDIRFERRGGIGLVTLNRPRVLNALTIEMFGAMHRQLQDWAEDARVHAVVIEGAGEKAFCAGGDIRSLYEAGLAREPLTAELFRVEYRLNRFIKTYPKPYVALMDGIAMGGGVGVSVHGSHRVATERSTFAMPETGIGFFPDVGAGFFLPRLPGRLGLYLGLTGARITAADMVHAGIATHFVPGDKLARLKEGLARAAPDREGWVDRILGGLAEDQGASGLSERRAAVDRCFAGGSVEAIMAALREEGGDWAQKTLTVLGAKSPTSLKMTFRQLTLGAELSFEDVMVMEYRLSQACMRGNDFYEGVRALIIDKDNAPRWSPARLEDVTESELDRAFEPLGDGDLRFD